jgi:hypothetical protein
MGGTVALGHVINCVAPETHLMADEAGPCGYRQQVVRKAAQDCMDNGREFDHVVGRGNLPEVMLHPPAPQLTLSMSLPGGQNRVRQLILYVATRCVTCRWFGAVKLNKIIWKADFDSFSDRQIPITGREYRRQPLGPVLRDMLPIHRDMMESGLISVERRDFGDRMVEHRTIARVAPDMSIFDEDDMKYIDASIRHYWDLTGTEASDESHGVAWKTRQNGDPMPYDLAFLSDDPIDIDCRLKIENLIYERGWVSE